MPNQQIIKETERMKWSKPEEGFINDYMEYELEELDYMLDNPQEIETGCPLNCDTCIDYELELIKEARIRKELADEHQREDL